MVIYNNLKLYFIKTEDFIIIKETEVLDEVSMDNIKGGLTDDSQLCCLINSRCNSNTNNKGQGQRSAAPNDNGGLVK